MPQQRVNPRPQATPILFACSEGKLALEALQQLAIGPCELNRTNPALRGRNQHAAQWRIRTHISDARCDCASPISIRSHSQLRSGALIQPAAGTVPGVVHGASYRVSCLQISLEHLQAARVGVGLRRDADYRLEAPLQMKRALMKFLRETLQCQWLVKMLLDEAAHRLHAIRLCVSTKRLWTAPQTGAISSMLGLFGP